MHRFLTPLMLILSVIPLWSGHFLPMVDLPQHAAQVATYLALEEPGFPFRDLFFINWFNPYLLGYCITIGLAKMLPITVAIKLVLTLSLIMYFFAFKWLRVKFQANPRTDWLIMPAWYGFTFNSGLFNFVIGLPFLLIFLGLVMQSLEQWNRTNAILVALGIHVLFFAHVLLAALGCVIAVELAFLKSQRIPDQIRRAAPALTVLPIALLWLLITKQQESKATKEVIMSYGLWPALSLLNPLAQIMGDKWWTRVAGLVLFALPVFQKGRVAYDLTRWTPFLTVAFIVLFTPTQILGTAFVSDRFSVLAFPFYLLGFSSEASSVRPVWRRLERVFPEMIATSLLIAIALRIISFNAESNGFSYVLRSMEPGKRVLSLIVEPKSEFFSLPVYLHFPVWYQVEKSGVVDYSFATSFPVMVRYHRDKDPSNSANYELLALRPKTFNWKLHQGWKYDYFVVRAPSDFQHQLFTDSDCSVKMVAARNGWWLYERDKSTSCIDRQ